ncbi:MAG: hypothetical protein ACREQ3_16455, partial [Candidatus Binatia bacterium]
PYLRKIVLTAHITFSVGWLGAVVPYLALAIASLTSHDAQMVRAAYLSMELIGWFAIVPLSLAALLSGLVQSLGTQWGLFRHWWIVAKFVLTIFAVVILWQHMGEVSRMARIAREAVIPSATLRSELIHSGAGLLVLLAATALSVFKPWGRTAYGRRAASQAGLRPSGEAALVREPGFVTSRPRWTRIAWIHVAHAVVIVLLFVVIQHLTGGGPRHH